MKDKLKKILVAGFLVGIMLFSVLGYSLATHSTYSSNSIKYNDYEFVSQNGFWYLTINDFLFVFDDSPYVVPEINEKINSFQSYYSKPLYIRTNNSLVENELVSNFGQISGEVENACLEGENCGKDELIKTCEDNFILVKEGAYLRVVQENNCLFIEGPEEEIVGIVDSVIFKIIGVNN